MKRFSKILIYLLVISIFTSCSKDSPNDEQSTSETNFSITDAPIDDSEVKAVFVTITDVKVDGSSLSGFNATTINLKALTKGKSELLGSLNLNVGTYSTIELVLDYNTDANGNAPGCYVELMDGTKDKIESTSSTISIKDQFDVLATTSNDIIIDFDLRKTIRKTSGTLQSDYKFVTSSELNSGLRVVNKANAGVISGTVTDSQDTSDKIIVYAYKKGTYNESVETQGQGESNVYFANAVSSCEVDKITGKFSINFLNSGDYELHLASYNDTDDDGEFEFTSTLQVESSTNIALNNINISSSLEIVTLINVMGTF